MTGTQSGLPERDKIIGKTKIKRTHPKKITKEKKLFLIPVESKIPKEAKAKLSKMVYGNKANETLNIENKNTD